MRTRTSRAGIALALAGLLHACGGAAGGGEVGHGILVVAIDGLRADHVSCLGYDRPTTPTLDGLAAEGVLFTRAFTSAPQLVPAHVGLLTGCEPYVARRVMPEEFEAPIERRWRVPDPVPHLAVELLAGGYTTAAFVDHPLISPAFGFGRGFQLFLEAQEGPADEPELSGSSALVPRVAQWLRGVGRSQDWFAYLHLHDLERSWTAPDPRWETYFTPRPGLDEVPPVSGSDSTFFAIPRSRWRGGSRTIGEYEALYDGHLRRVDDALERLLGSIRAAGRFERTTIVVVGTHGVQFGEAGLYLCSGRYSDVDLRVPWIVRPAAGTPWRAGVGPGARVDALASLVDVAPTLLALAGIDVPSGTHGRSQAGRFARVDGDAGEPREYVYVSCGLQDGCAVIGERHCLEYLLPSEAGSPSLRRSWWGRGSEPEPGARVRFYDRLADPYPPLGERVRGEDPAERERFQAAGSRWIHDVQNTRRALQTTTFLNQPLEPEVIAELKELGWLGEDY